MPRAHGFARAANVKAIGYNKTGSARFVLRQVNNRQTQYKDQQDGQQQQPAYPPDFHQPQRNRKRQHSHRHPLRHQPEYTRRACLTAGSRAS